MGKRERESINHLLLSYLICYASRSQTRFKSMEIRGSSFTAFIDVLTNNTYAMIVMSDPNIRMLLQKQNSTLVANPFFCYDRICSYFT